MQAIIWDDSGHAAPHTAPAASAELHDAAQRAQRIAGDLAQRGWTWVELAVCTHAGTGLQPIGFCDQWAPPGWPAEYRRLRGWEADPRLPAACLRGLPHFWQTERLAAAGGQAHHEAAARAVALALRRHGIAGGVSLVLGSAAPGQCLALHLLSALPQVAPPHTDDLLALLSLAHALADAGEMLARHRSADSGITLSGLQLQVARWVALGLCDKEVARRVDASRHAVDYHLRELRRKFCVRNRVELALQIERHLAAPPTP